MELTIIPECTYYYDEVNKYLKKTPFNLTKPLLVDPSNQKIEEYANSYGEGARLLSREYLWQE